MHFFYLDESGDTGKNLDDPAQPIFVLGGVSLRDEGWNATHAEYMKLVTRFLGAVPANFELHGSQLLGTEGMGPFAGKPPQDRYDFAHEVLDLIAARKHNIHWIAFDKQKVKAATCGLTLTFNPKRPYPLGFNYHVGYINDHVKTKLGQSARGMIIADEKQQYKADVEAITHDRRFEGAATHRVKWVVEISYAVDSKKNAMIQLSDLCMFCIRKFLEIEHGHQHAISPAAAKYYAQCYKKIDARVQTKGLVPHPSPKMKKLNEYIEAVRCAPKANWKKRYEV